MKHLVRSLVLAIVLIPALAGTPPAKAVSEPQLEACVDGDGHCSVTGEACAVSGQCNPRPQTCVCDS